MSSCDGVTCCRCEPEFRAVMVRDGVAIGVCTECRQEVPILSVPESPPPPYPNAAMCGDYTKSDIAHQWGGPL